MSQCHTIHDQFEGESGRVLLLTPAFVQQYSTVRQARSLGTRLNGIISLVGDFNGLEGLLKQVYNCDH